MKKVILNQMTRKKLLWLSSILGSLLIGIFFIHSIQVSAQPSSITIQTTANATTTVTYMSAGTATSTYQFDSPSYSSGKEASNMSVDKIAVYIQFTASTTGSVLGITPQYSNNNIDWYNYNAFNSTVTSSGYTNLASSSITYYYNPNSTIASTTGTVFIVPDVPSVHERLVFSIPVGSTPGAVYAEVDLKKNPQTP